ncbi:ABC transporter permease [Aggregicoccus sp. 17bor-14]|uniref:ABC transporter permease n=1 Tax=Myxococcaceae TaxID=31 RepID=UPI00129C9F44|nr:ABC transporter permease [Simulacricoccus sp. 17bor-14]MRI92202.1 ABC transporter permease [Aggregicoccus sp. 17bor-14]
MIDELGQDLRYALRMLRRQPGFALVAVLTLALGIGANTAIFSVVDALLLKPLPYAGEEALVMVWETNREGKAGTTSPMNFRDWRKADAFSGLAAFSNLAFNLAGSGEAPPERVQASSVSSNFFEVLGVRPMLGATFEPAPDGVADARTVVLSHRLWQRRFGGDPGIVGRTVRLDDAPYTVLGVMPAGFEWAQIAPKGASARDAAELWTPAPHHDVPQLGVDTGVELSSSRGTGYLRVVGRLAPGVSLAQAGSRMQALGAQLARDFPEDNAGSSIRVLPLREQLYGSTRPMLLVLLAAVGLVLAIACANVANLFLARAAGRGRELAVRTALGARRGRLVRQLLTESLLVALAAGALGLLLAAWGVDALLALEPADVPRLTDVGLDGAVLLFTLGVSLGTGLLFGLLPALHASDLDLHATLKQGAGVKGGGRGKRSRAALVVAETALALVLLVSAGLLLQGFWRLQHVDPGFEPDRLLSFAVNLPKQPYSDEARQTAFYRQVLERLSALPGVERAGAVLTLPFGRDNIGLTLNVEGRPPPPPGREQPTAGYQVASQDYFATLGIPLLRGRGFLPTDVDGSLPVVLLSEAAAKANFPGEDPVGRRIRMGGEGNRWLTVVGVVGDVRHGGLGEPPRAEVYRPFEQDGWAFLTFVLRTRGEPTALAQAARDAVRAVDGQLAIARVQPVRALVDASIARERFLSLLVGVFAAVALLLAAVGLYGVISYAARGRTQEIGVRMALGARPADVLRLVLGSGLRLALGGVALGLVGAWGAGRLLASQLPGVRAADPLTLAALALAVCAVALAATWLPARRAMRVDPQEALRAE